MGLLARTLIWVDGRVGGAGGARCASLPQTPFLTCEQNEAYRAAEPGGMMPVWSVPLRIRSSILGGLRLWKPGG